MTSHGIWRIHDNILFNYFVVKGCCMAAWSDCMAEGEVPIHWPRVKILERRNISISALPEVILHGCFWGEWLFIELLVEACDLWLILDITFAHWHRLREEWDCLNACNFEGLASATQYKKSTRGIGYSFFFNSPSARWETESLMPLVHKNIIMTFSFL